MGDSKCSSDDMLERILQDRNSMPRVMQLEYLKRITDNFSDKRLLGAGGFGQVYKGKLQNGKMIAVKKFKQLTNPDVQEKLFMNEVFPLMSLRHCNIVRCVGYCSEKSSEVVMHNGIFVLAESQPEMLLCLEYLTMGSLDKHLKDESSGLDWRTCYKIIKGVCHGLHYLHEGCRPKNNNAVIIHLDLKPANILLDENMVPKIADFGLSKFLYDKKTQTSPIEGTPGYMAPEYISKGKISTKADIYSLGVVIIEIITGCKADPDMDPDVEQMISKWRNRSAEALSSVDCQQIRSCLEIGKSCIKSERNGRPTTGKIVERLSLESIDCSIDSEEGPILKKTKQSSAMPPQDQEKGIIMKIKEHMEKLIEKCIQVHDNIELAKGNGMVATNKIDTWLARADAILSDGMVVCESKQTGLNLDTRIAVAQLGQLRECLNDQPTDIAQPPPVLHIDVHTVLLPSQVLFVEQARQHIIEDTEGMIGIWGPVGVGKTLLLREINNSFETGHSLIPSSSNKGDPPFDFVIYMTVLEGCSVQSIQSEIIQRLKMEDHSDSITAQATRIFEFLQDKSFLVLLDGLHCNLNLAAVGVPPLGNQGQLKRKVVITTRSRSLCDQMRVNRAINVPSLKMNEALQLFQECIGNDSLYSEPHIGALARDLVEQLRAVPSELIRIGSAMRGKGEPGQWQNIIGVAKELMHIKDQQNLQEAEAVADFAMDEAEKNHQLDILRLKAQIQASRGQFKPAVESFRVLLATIQIKKEVWESTTCNEVKCLQKLEMDSWLDLASIYSKLEAWHDSDICLDKAISIDFFYPNCWHVRGLLLEAQFLHKEALMAFSFALSIDPEYVPSMVCMAGILRNIGGNSLSIARTYLRNALRLEPTNHRAWLSLGLVLKVEESLQEAADCFQAAYELRELSPIQDFSEQLLIMLH